MKKKQAGKATGETPEHHFCIITERTVRSFLRRMAVSVSLKSSPQNPIPFSRGVLVGKPEERNTRSAGYDHFEDLAVGRTTPLTGIL
jgi:hypothetical protein